MSDISMVELRILGVIGLVATATVTVLLVAGGAALGRLAWQALDRYRGGYAGMAPTPATPRCGLLVPGAGHSKHDPEKGCTDTRRMQRLSIGSARFGMVSRSLHPRPSRTVEPVR